MAIKENDFLALPEYWQLTPLGKMDKTGKINPKAPYLNDWQSKDVDRDFIQSEIDAGKAVGIGLRLGESSGYVVAIDFDGQSAIDLGRELFGELPETVTWTSGISGRYQALFVVPEQYRDRVKNKVVKTDVIGDDGKAEQLEFRYTGNQSVLPPSPHPTTDRYKWINNPIDTPVAELPQSAVEYWLTLLVEPKVKQQKTKGKPPAKQQQLKTANKDIPPIPLKNCLAKSNQNLLGGVSEGGRNQAGTALSRDLIGCANYLNSEGIPYDGDPRDLFDGFVDNCSPPIGFGKDDDPDEPDRIWRSAEGDNPSPACTAEGIKNITEAWNKKHSSQEDKKTAGDRLLEITKTDAEYFHTSDKVPYADIIIDGNRHTYSIRCKTFRLWLLGEYYKAVGKGVSSQTLQDTLSRRWLPVYDNVGHISPDQSDDLCRVATNFGYSTRTLHTTDEETTFEFTRPQIVTAIDALVTRDDLADRVLMVQLPEIAEDKRLPQAELDAKVEASRPRILGALLTALSQTLAAIPNTKPKTLPRMADYALFAIASEGSLGLKTGTFREIFDQSREQSRKVVIESSPVGEAIIRLMDDYPLPKAWKGTASELLKELENYTDDATYRSRYFPKASNLLSRQLNRLTPDLKSLGINISESRIHGGTRQIILEKAVKVSSPSSPKGDKTPNDPLGQDSTGDDTVTVNDEGDDTFQGDDGVTIEKGVVVTHESNTQQAFGEFGDDGDDKKSLFFNTSVKKNHQISVLKVGDRIRYVGGMTKYKGKFGKVTKVCGDFAKQTLQERYVCDFDGKLTEQLPREELEMAL